MRLSSSQIEAIKQEAMQYSGASRRVRGFTMVELITVMVILGILATVAAPRFFDRDVFESRGFYDQVISTLRYAQKAAIAQHRFVCVAFTASSVNLTYGTNSNCTVDPGTLASPSGTPYPLTSINATFSSFPVAGFSFDCLGRPNNMTLATGVCGNSLAVLIATPPATYIANISVSGYSGSIYVEQETGYVH